MGNVTSVPCKCIREKDVVIEQHKIAAEREEGQALLRSMVTSSSSSDEIDWQAVIAKANELHKREQEWLRKQSQKHQVMFIKRQRRALQRRKRLDSIGSFSVNLLTYRMTDLTSSSSSSTAAAVFSSTPQVVLREHCDLDDSGSKGGRFSKSSTSIGSSREDTESASHCSSSGGGLGGGFYHVEAIYLSKSQDEMAMEPIREQSESVTS